MSLLKKIYKKFKRPTEWIEIKVPSAISKVAKKIRGKGEEE